MQVAFGIAPRLTLSTGLVYTRTSSDFYPYAPGSSYNVHQVLHYVGIPVGLNYEFWQSGGFHAYVMAGAEADYNVKNDTEEEGVKKENAKRDRVQLSGKASLGAQYDITPKVGLYIEPGAKYYFDNGSHVEKENKKLQKQVDQLTTENSNLQEEKYELDRLQDLYKLDQTYAEYPKVGARVIGKDSGNWFSTLREVMTASK